MEIDLEGDKHCYLYKLDIGNTFYDSENQRHYILIQKLSGGEAILDAVDLLNGTVRNFDRCRIVNKTEIKARAKRIK